VKLVKFLNQKPSDFFDLLDFHKIQKRTVFKFMYFLNGTREKNSLKFTIKPGAEVQNFSYSFHSIFLGPFLNLKYLKTYTFSIDYQLPIIEIPD